MRKPLRKKDRVRKIRLIKKYARIRFHRFWREWGVTREEAGMFIGALSVFVIPFALYILACMF